MQPWPRRWQGPLLCLFLRLRKQGKVDQVVWEQITDTRSLQFLGAMKDEHANHPAVNVCVLRWLLRFLPESLHVSHWETNQTHMTFTQKRWIAHFSLWIYEGEMIKNTSNVSAQAGTFLCLCWAPDGCTARTATCLWRIWRGKQTRFWIRLGMNQLLTP